MMPPIASPNRLSKLPGMKSICARMSLLKVDDSAPKWNSCGISWYPRNVRESAGAAPRMTSRPAPNGGRATPGKFWIALSASPWVPGRLLISCTVIVRRDTSSGSLRRADTTVRYGFTTSRRWKYFTSTRAPDFSSSTCSNRSYPCASATTRTLPSGAPRISKLPSVRVIARSVHFGGGCSPYSFLVTSPTSASASAGTTSTLAPDTGVRCPASSSTPVSRTGPLPAIPGSTSTGPCGSTTPVGFASVSVGFTSVGLTSPGLSSLAGGAAMSMPTDFTTSTGRPPSTPGE
jgi:hypothetical protein